MAASAVATETDLQLEIIADRKDLLRGLTTVIGVVERKTTIPILTNILLEAKADGFLKLSATNLDQSITTEIPVQVRCEGSLTIPGRKLYEYVKLLSGDSISIRQEENNWAHIRCGRSKTNMVGMSRSQFPQIPELTATVIELDPTVLRVLIDKASITVSHEESRYTLNGALLKLGNGSAAMISTDGHRLTNIWKTTDVDAATAGDFMIPAAALKELAPLLKEAQSLRFADDGTSLFFQMGETVLTSRKITGSFPNYQAVIPQNPKHAVTLDTEVVSGMLGRTVLFSNAETRAIALQLSTKELRLSSAAADLGETEEIIEILGPEKPIEIGFNGDYLREFFSSITGSVELALTDSNGAALFTWRNDDGFTMQFVVMPMRLKG